MASAQDRPYRLTKALAHAAWHVPCGRVGEVRVGGGAAVWRPERLTAPYVVLLHAHGGRLRLQDGRSLLPLAPGAQALVDGASCRVAGQGTFRHAFVHVDAGAAGDPLRRLVLPLVADGDAEIAAEWRRLVADAAAVRQGHPLRRPKTPARAALLLTALIERAAAAGALRFRDAPGPPDWLLRALVVLEQRLSDPSLAVADLVRASGRSPAQLRRAFTAHLGRSPQQQLLLRRLQLAARLLLAEAQASVQEVAAASGFEDPAYFGRVFRRRFGAPPGRWRGEDMPARR